MNDYSISVVIPAYNCEKTISQTLSAVSNQTYSNKIEIIVVDDGSTDKTPTIVKSFDNVAYIRQENSGPAAARNAGIRNAHGNLIFFTDSDCVPKENWIEKGINGFNDPNVAVVAGSYGIMNTQSRLARCIHKEILYRHNNLMPNYPKSFGSYNFCAKKKVLDVIGGFDENYKNASGEDNDLSYKIIKSGYKIYFDKENEVLHYYPESLQKYIREQFFHGFWRAKIYFDHLEMAKGDDYTFWKDIIEPPIVIILALSLLLSFFSAWFALLFVNALITILLIEIVYSILICKVLIDALFYSSVMFSRAVSRTCGFLLGILRFFTAKLSKKN